MAKDFETERAWPGRAPVGPTTEVNLDIVTNAVATMRWSMPTPEPEKPRVEWDYNPFSKQSMWGR
jgi:hypothetical protein